MRLLVFKGIWVPSTLEGALDHHTHSCIAAGCQSIPKLPVFNSYHVLDDLHSVYLY